MTDTTKAELAALFTKLSSNDLIWASGYIQARLDMVAGLVEPLAPAAPQTPFNLGIYFATETGNSKKVAIAAEKLAKSKQIKTKALAFSKFKQKDLEKQDATLFILSTHGEGEYPDSSKVGISFLEGQADLSHIKYSILGLGDQAYEIFCGAAKQLETLLETKGASSFSPSHHFDVDYEAHYQAALTKIFGDLPLPSPSNTVLSDMPAPSIVASVGTSRLNAVTGTITEHINLNDVDSAKETFHIEIEFDDDVHYEPGDALGIIVPEQSNGKTPPPRLYSIASAQESVDNNVHITVALAHHKNEDGTTGFGVCSHYLAELSAGDAVKFYIHKNNAFKLPSNSDTPIIMVGPGTGIAPFRAFMQQRESQDAQGENWLFFGDRTSHADFLYQTEWQDYAQNGLLTRIDLAFSRDDPQQKVYVQHKMQEQGADLIDWLDNKGAYLYICGAKDPMSKDVEKTLIDIAIKHKNISQTKAETWLEALADTGRYLKDVY